MRVQAGAGFWLTDAGAVRAQAEALAKAQFAARRDPQDCALLYIALGRRPLLQARRLKTPHTLLLWRLPWDLQGASCLHVRTRLFSAQPSVF
jgi:hypothetical protein